MYFELMSQLLFFVHMRKVQRPESILRQLKDKNMRQMHFIRLCKLLKPNCLSIMQRHQGLLFDK